MKYSTPALTPIHTLFLKISIGNVPWSYYFIFSARHRVPESVSVGAYWLSDSIAMRILQEYIYTIAN